MTDFKIHNPKYDLDLTILLTLQQSRIEIKRDAIFPNEAHQCFIRKYYVSQDKDTVMTSEDPSPVLIGEISKSPYFSDLETHRWPLSLIHKTDSSGIEMANNSDGRPK